MSDEMKTYDCEGCSDFCYGGYHMEEVANGYGDWVRKEDHETAMTAANAQIAALEAKVASGGDRDAVLEEAAKVCDERAKRSQFARGGMGQIFADTQDEDARQCAAAIRALQQPHGDAPA